MQGNCNRNASKSPASQTEDGKHVSWIVHQVQGKVIGFVDQLVNIIVEFATAEQCLGCAHIYICYMRAST